MAYSQAWLASPASIRGILIVLNAAKWNGSSWVETPFYVSNIGFITDDSLTAFSPIVTAGLTFTETLNKDSAPAISFGDIELSNTNGELDAWLDSSTYIWVNRPITVYLGDPTWPCANLAAIVSGFATVFTGLISDIDSKTRNTLNIKVRDNLERLNTPLTENTLGVVAGWADQTNQDALKPLVFGEVFNTIPLLIDPANLEYMVNDGNTELVIEVRDNGIPLYTHNGTSVTLNGTTTTVTATKASVVNVITVTATVASNVLVCSTTVGLITNNAITISGTTFGGISAGTYYIKNILSPTTITLSASLVSGVAGTVVTVTSATGTMTGTSTNTNILICDDASNIYAGKPVVFSGTVIGDIVANTVYYIKDVYDTISTGSNSFSIASTVGGVTTTLTTASGSMTATLPAVLVDTTAGKFRLTQPLKGVCTASVMGIKNSINLASGTLVSGTYVNNIANIIALITTQYGKVSTRLTASDLDLANLSAFQTSNPQVIGFLITDKSNILVVCNAIASSIGAQIYMTRTGQLQLLQYGVPISTAVVPNVTITDSDIIHHSLQIVGKLSIDPTSKIGFCKAWSTQNNLLTNIPASHKDLFTNQWVSETDISTGSSTVTTYKIESIPVQKDSYLIDNSEALAEATRLVNYYKTPRIIYKLTGLVSLMSLQLGQQVTLKHSRFNLSAGVVGQVVSLSPNWLQSTIDIEVIV